MLVFSVVAVELEEEEGGKPGRGLETKRGLQALTRVHEARPVIFNKTQSGEQKADASGRCLLIDRWEPPASASGSFSTCSEVVVDLDFNKENSNIGCF